MILLSTGTFCPAERGDYTHDRRGFSYRASITAQRINESRKHADYLDLLLQTTGVIYHSRRWRIICTNLEQFNF